MKELIRTFPKRKLMTYFKIRIADALKQKNVTHNG